MNAYFPFTYIISDSETVKVELPAIAEIYY